MLPKQPSTKDKFRDLANMIENLNNAIILNQDMIKKHHATISKMQNDLTHQLNLVNDLQFRTLAMLNTGNFDMDKIDAEADKLKLQEYNRLSDIDDSRRGYEAIDEVTPDSTIIFSTSTDTQDNIGIFRSKMAVSTIPFEAMRVDVVGKKVGDTFDTTINNVTHHVTIHGIRKLKDEQPKE